MPPRIFAGRCSSPNPGGADAVFFTPFNKKAMRLAYEGYDDEIRFVRDVLNTSAEASEFNVLGNLWNARVTSHIPLSQVSAAISEQRDPKSSRRSRTAACAAPDSRSPALRWRA